MKVTCKAYSNLALIKYWGNRNDALRLPMSGSISFNLDQAFTTTTVAFGNLTAGQVELDGTPASSASARMARVRISDANILDNQSTA
jgi:diphosphomevalonate decarboxylase